MQRLLLGRERLVAAQLREHVVEPGERHVLVRRLARLAVRVDLLGERADALGEGGDEAGVVGGEGVGFEAGRVVVDRSIFERAARSQSPLDMASARQDTEQQCVVARDHPDLLVGQHVAVDEHEGPVFGGLGRADVATQPVHRLPKLHSGFSEVPPVVPVARPLVLGALRLDPFEQPLVRRGIVVANLVFSEPEEVEGKNAATLPREIASVRIPANAPAELWVTVQAKGGYGRRINPEARAQRNHAHE